MTDETNQNAPGASPGQPGDEASRPQPTSLGRRFLSLLRSTGIFDPDEWPVRKLLGTAIGLCLAIFLLAVALQGVAHVREGQVGVMVNNVTGNLGLRERVGYYCFCPYLARFYLLDKTSSVPTLIP